ncbi:MAG TPA: hypothetical protein VGB54_10745 [Allosphingosinicella sp.]|jgi:hypothetical protein
MKRLDRLAILGGAAALLASCASGPATRQRPGARPAQTVQPARGNPMPVRGDAVMGRNAQGLVSLFGPPALDVREGRARKLQFLNPNCVLDAYLYPPARGEAVVTHVDTRLPDGRDADRSACIAALRSR